jgi:hypothetical protein
MDAILTKSDCMFDQSKWYLLQESIPEVWWRDRLEARILHTYMRLPRFFKCTETNAVDMGGEVFFELESLRQQLQALDASIEKLSSDFGLDLETASEDWIPSQYAKPACRWHDDVRLVDAFSILYRSILIFARVLQRLGMLGVKDLHFTKKAARRLLIVAEHGQLPYRQSGLPTAVLNMMLIRPLSSAEIQARIDATMARVDSLVDPGLMKLVNKCKELLQLQLP